MLDLLQYLKNEYNLTSNVIYILLLCEIVFIAFYLYLPFVLNKVTSNYTIVLLDKSRFLEREYKIASGEQVKIPPKNDLISHTSAPEFRQNFGISMWIYLNPQGTNYDSYSKETPLFSYGNGKPKITHIKNESGKKGNDTYRIYFTDEQSKKNYYEIGLPQQKWNNFTFNYASTHVDLFINGNLNRTYNFAANHIAPPQYLASDSITTGANNGLDGAICNVRYYKQPLTSSEVANLYNILAFKNPPTFSV